jgi:Glycine rich protein
MRVPSHSSGLHRLALLLFWVGLGFAAVAVAVVQRANATTITLATFTKPGTYVWAVPKGVTNATFTVFGASGGGVLRRNANHTITTISVGGPGGEAKAAFAVHAGEKFEIVVGEQGGGGYDGQSSGLGGANGGGAGGPWSGGGGGGSDVRVAGRSNTCVSTKSCGFGDRIIVGGGGGGGGEPTGLVAVANGLSGGGLTGAAPTCLTYPGPSAAQECGGNAGVPQSVGQFGLGGVGEKTWDGGGGGGWYGGAAGDVRGANGGGGSGYISPFAKSGSFPGGHQQGNGKVTIATTR